MSREGAIALGQAWAEVLWDLDSAEGSISHDAARDVIAEHGEAYGATDADVNDVCDAARERLVELCDEQDAEVAS